MQRKKLFCLIVSLIVFCLVMVPVFVIAMKSPEGKGTETTESGTESITAKEAIACTGYGGAEGTALDLTGDMIEAGEHPTDFEGRKIVEGTEAIEGKEGAEEKETIEKIDEIEATEATEGEEAVEEAKEGEVEARQDQTGNQTGNEKEIVNKTDIMEADKKPEITDEPESELESEPAPEKEAESLEERISDEGERQRTPTAEEVGFPTKDQAEQKMSAGLMSVQTQNDGYARIGNDYVEYAVNRNGRFTIGTTGGDPEHPEDNHKKMIYGHPVSSTGGTSYTTVRVDELNYIYKIDDNSAQSIDETKNSHSSTMTINGVLLVTQELAVVENATTQRPDTVQIKYTVENLDTVGHSLGLRIMLDTMLGNNDSAPFRIPGYGDLTKQKEFAEKDVPLYWQAFDSLINPSVIANGTLIKSTVGMPSRVQFTSWGTVNGTPWGHVPNEGRYNGDSAVCVIWDEETIAAGERKTFVTYYGLSCFATTQTEKMLVSLSVPKALAADDTEQFYEPDPFRISLYLKNISGETITNVKTRVMLPAEVRLFGSSRSQPEIYIEEIAPFAEEQCSWLLYADAQVESREVTIKVVVTAEGMEEIVIPHKVFLPRLRNGVASYSVKMGNEFTQTVYPDRTVAPPCIHDVHIETIAPGKYRLSLEEGDYTVSSKATPFFCWEALEGSFEQVDDSFRTVIYNAPTDTQGRRILLKAHIGDGLGYAVQYKFWVDGIS